MSDFDPRRAKPGDVFTITGPDGSLQDFHSDDDGVVRPDSPEQAILLDHLGVPVARSVLKADKAATAEAEPQKLVGEGAAKAEGGKD